VALADCFSEIFIAGFLRNGSYLGILVLLDEFMRDSFHSSQQGLELSPKRHGPAGSRPGILMDNGPEFIETALNAWLKKIRSQIHLYYPRQSLRKQEVRKLQWKVPQGSQNLCA
jgi:hypothetical protein